MGDRGKIQRWQGLLVGLLGGWEVIGLSMSPAVAQSVIVPDVTLGAENSEVIQNFNGLPIEVIIDGARRGQNLFHSFQEFNVTQGRSAYFFGRDASIQNILARITGTNASNIDGRLGTFLVVGGQFVPSNANLFLINPNGIIFGTGASLDIGGSFVATTANAVQFPNGDLFSASAPTAPSQVLTVNPSALLYNAIAAQNVGIINRSAVSNSGNLVSTTNGLNGLQVPNGRSLLLVGGDVQMEGGILQAPGGRVELGGLSATGTVGLTTTGGELRLEFAEGVARSDVALINSPLSVSGINVAADGGGSIAINARNLDILGGSLLQAGIASGLGTTTSQAGNITTNATGALRIEGGGVFNTVQGGATGNAGDSIVTAGSLTVTNGAQLNSSTSGQGAAGNVAITVRDAATFDGVGSTGLSSGAVSAVGPNAVGNGGTLTFNAGSLIVTNGAVLTSSTFGQGDAGNVSITVHDAATFDGRSSNGSASFAGSTVNLGAVGKGGTLTLSADSLSVTNGAVLTSSTFGQGDAGDVSITVRDAVVFDGMGNSGDSSSAGSEVGRNAVGKGGTLTLSAGSLSVTNGALLSSSTRGQGDAGNVSITVRDAAIFDGVGSNGDSSSAGSAVNPGAMGKGGTLTLSAGSLNVTNGASLGATTFSQGDAGDISITVHNAATFDGVGSNGSPGRATTQVGSNAVGKGGTLTLFAGSLNVTNGAQLSSSSFGQGDAGDVSITVRDAATFDGVGSNGFSSAAGSTVESNAVGKGGTLTLSAGSLNVTNGAGLSATTFGQGDAGDVSIIVRDAATFDGVGGNGALSFAGSTVGRNAVGKGGTLTLTAGSLNVINGAQLTSSTFGRGDAGNISITVRDAATLDGADSNGNLSFAGSAVDSNAVGKGGTLTFFAGSLTITNGGALSSSSLGQGDAGDIVLRVRGALQLSNGNISTLSEQTAGGSIDITAKSIRLLGNSNIVTSVFSGIGNGGNITLSANSIVALNDSDILAFARDGRGGNITLNTRAFFGQNYRPAPFGTDPRILDGNNRVDINASGTVSGIITLPDVSFIQSSLTQLSQTQIDTNQLLATSCIVRRNQPNPNSFYITGPGGLPDRPGTPSSPTFPTGEIRNLATDAKTDETDKSTASSVSPSAAQFAPPRPWQIGDPIQEPDGVYQLPNGELILSHQCR